MAKRHLTTHGPRIDGVRVPAVVGASGESPPQGAPEGVPPTRFRSRGGAGTLARPATRRPPGWPLAALAGMLTANLLLPGRARTQVALEQFKPAPLASDGFAVSRPEGLGHLEWSAMALLGYANDPLVYQTEPGNSDSETTVVADHLVIHPSLALGLGSRLTLFISVPIHALMAGEQPPRSVPAADGAGLGDVAVGARLRIVGGPDSTFALAGELLTRLPTARLTDSEQVYSGARVGSYEPGLIAELRTGRLELRVRAAGRLREEIALGNLALGHELVAGVGARLRIADFLSLHAEGYGSTFTSALFKREHSPLETLFGFKIQTRGFNVGAAAGPGLAAGYGSPDVRVVGTIGYAALSPQDTDGDGIVEPADHCPDAAEDRDGFQDADGCPDSDNDRDGIVDDRDECQNEPEDRDGFEDGNGCPDEDNDQDGVPDEADACREEAEDKDGVQDEDGCPDPDNDGDGMPDEGDHCPNEPEDADDFEDTDGCPDPDNDADGLLDSDDRCPLKAEDEDGFEDEDGCPEEGSPRVRLTCEQIQIGESVHFAPGSDMIESRSFALLNDVVALVQKARHIRKLRIEGHTDDRGRARANLKLSRRRAAAVMRYFVSRGVDPMRLAYEGYGTKQPIADNRTPAGRAKNRRVEFNIVAQTSDCEP